MKCLQLAILVAITLSTLRSSAQPLPSSCTVARDLKPNVPVTLNPGEFALATYAPARNTNPTLLPVTTVYGPNQKVPAKLSYALGDALLRSGVVFTCAAAPPPIPPPPAPQCVRIPESGKTDKGEAVLGGPAVVSTIQGYASQLGAKTDLNRIGLSDDGCLHVDIVTVLSSSSWAGGEIVVPKGKTLCVQGPNVAGTGGVNWTGFALQNCPFALH